MKKLTKNLILKRNSNFMNLKRGADFFCIDTGLPIPEDALKQRTEWINFEHPVGKMRQEIADALAPDNLYLSEEDRLVQALRTIGIKDIAEDLLKPNTTHWVIKRSDAILMAMNPLEKNRGLETKFKLQVYGSFGGIQEVTLAEFIKLGPKKVNGNSP